MGAFRRLVRSPLTGGPHMTNPWLAAAVALFVWWFSTGAILWRVARADRAGGRAHLNSTLYSLPLLALGLAGLVLTRDQTTVASAYLAFLSALALWGWIEIAFLSGIVTGPNRRPLPPGSDGFDRFWRATLTVLWHELTLIGALGLLVLVAGSQANPFGLWSFVILFFARASAKLNLFFGVPRIHTEFLPQPLAHLASHFRRAGMNGFFPVSITALSFASACFLERLWNARTEGHVIGFTLLSALTLLALLEHWFMVIPLPDQKLWRWMLPDQHRTQAKQPGIPRPEQPLTVRK